MTVPGASLTRNQKVFTMVGALLGMLLAALDQTIVATAGPRIQVKLSIDAGTYVWITTSYIVASTVLVPIYGKLSDMYGRRRVLLAAIIIFLAGSALCGQSRNAMQLIACRALQGVGSAGLFTSAFAVVADLFPPVERGKWQGLFGAVFGLASVVGPLAGGFIADNLGWQWAFYVNLPVGAVAIVLILSHMPPLRQENVSHRLDIAGAVALAAGIVPLLLALSLGDQPAGWPWASWQIGLLFALAAGGIAAFVMIERRAASPILEFGMFRNRTVAIGCLGAFVIGATFLAAIVYLPLFMVNVAGVSATDAGLTTTPLTFGIVAANVTSGQLVSRIGSYKATLLVSLGILLVGFVVLATTLLATSTQGSVSAKMVLLGLGMGPSIPLFTLAIQNAVPPHQIGVATASATFFRQLGSTIGIAIIGTVFATSFGGMLKANLANAMSDMPADVRAGFAPKEAGGAGEGEGARIRFDADAQKARVDEKLAAMPMPAAERAARRTLAFERIDRVDHAFKDAFTDAIVNVFWLAFAIAIVGLVITLFLPSLPLRRAGPPRTVAE